MAETKKFVFLLVNEFSHLAFSCAVEPLRIANLVSGEDLYSWSFISEDGQSATCSNGSVTLVDRGFTPMEKDEHLFVLSGLDVWKNITPETLAFIRREKAHGTKIGALCSGAFVLAEAGCLDGATVALHWEYHDSFMEKFPEVNLCRNVFVSTEKYITASGGTATADLILHMIEKEHGAELAIAVSDQMVYTSAREETAEQRASLQSRYGMRNPHIVKAIQLMNDTIENPISSALIAEEIGISTRQLERIFGRHLNCSPAKYYLDIRLKKAQHLLIQTEFSVTQVGILCGFSSSGHFSRAFRTHFGITPHMQLTKSS